METSSGARIYVSNEPRDAKDKAPIRVTLVGEDSALNEAERQITEASALSARFVERVIHCKAFQARERAPPLPLASPAGLVHGPS